MTPVKEIDMQSMGQLRQASQKITQFLHHRLNGYFTTITPLFAPRKVLGEFMESAFKDKVPGADGNFIELQEIFKEIATEAFDIPAKLNAPIPNIRNQLEIYPWEYRYRIGDDPADTVTITSPVRWVLAYAGGYSLSDLLEQQASGEQVDTDDLRRLLLHSLTMHKLIELSPAIRQLLDDLRFPLTVETSEASGKLPYVVVGSEVPAFRPQDDLIRTVTQLSGKPVFEELIDTAEIDAMTDPFKGKLAAFIG